MIFLSTHNMDLFILKTYGEKFTSTNKKTLHLIFKVIECFSTHTDDATVRGFSLVRVIVERSGVFRFQVVFISEMVRNNSLSYN